MVADDGCGTTDLQMYGMLDSPTQRIIVSYLKRVYVCCENTASTNPEAVVSFVARFLNRVLHSLNHAALSRPQSPEPATIDMETLGPAIQPAPLPDVSISHPPLLGDAAQGTSRTMDVGTGDMLVPHDAELVSGQEQSYFIALSRCV